MKCYEDLMWYLLEKTKAKICFSLIIPTKNSTTLNKKIEEINDALTKMVTDGRAANPLHKSCLFSYSNNCVQHQYIHNKGCQEVKLTVPGKLIMWTRLCDGFKKTLRLPRKQLSKGRDDGSTGESHHINNQNNRKND